MKVVIDFANFLGPDTTFYNINKKEQITLFLNKKIKSSDIDPDKRWITTWNHFLNRIKLFMRWLYNYHYRLNQASIHNNYDNDINDNNFFLLKRIFVINKIASKSESYVVIMSYVLKKILGINKDNFPSFLLYSSIIYCKVISLCYLFNSFCLFIPNFRFKYNISIIKKIIYEIS